MDLNQPLDPRTILEQALALPAGKKLTLLFSSTRARTGFKRKLAAYRGVIKRKSYSFDPLDPAFGISPYDSIVTVDQDDATLLIINRPSAEDVGIISITES